MGGILPSNQTGWLKLPDFSVKTKAATDLTEGYFTYSVSNGEVTITKCDKTVSGEISVPSTIDELPVTKIGDSAFNSCLDLSGITIPDTVTDIGSMAFYSCKNLVNITLSKNITAIRDYSFMRCSSLENIVIPNGVKYICVQAFYDCENLKSIILPNSLKEIYIHAFFGCASLEEIIIPDSVEKIGIRAFSECSSLKSIVIPSKVTCIETDTFMDCTALSSVYLPEDMESIGARAFKNCANLKSITIPKSVNAIFSEAFENCTSLADVSFSNCGIKSIPSNTFANCTSLNNIVIPNSVTSIGENAFTNCTSLANIVIPDSIKNIGYEAFLNTAYFNSNSNWDNGVLYLGKRLISAEKLTADSYEIKAGTLTVAARAFWGRFNLDKITIPDSVKYIGQNAFFGSGSNNVYITDLLAWLDIDFENCYSNPLHITGNLYLDGSLVSDLVIPNGVATIKKYAFYGMDSLNSVTLPSSVNYIGTDAFQSCRKLKGVYITDLAAWCGIDFQNRYSNPLVYAKYLYLNDLPVTDLVIPDGVATIREYAFNTCYTLTSITIPNSVKVIEDNQFTNCINLTGVYITDLTAWCKIKFDGYRSNPLCIARNLYLNGELVTDLVIPNDITEVKNYAFYNCLSIEDLVVSDKVTNIMDYAFYNCKNIKNISMPNDIKRIAVGAFNKCAALESVYYRNVSGDKPSVSIGADNDYYKKANKYYDACIGSPDHTYTDSCVADCRVCGFVREITHSYKTLITKATTKKDGSIVTKCSLCGDVESNDAIKYAKTFTLSTKSYTYNGAVKTPTVTVKDSSGKIIAQSNYTVTYASGRKYPGTYRVTVKMQGNYTGTKTLEFNIDKANVSNCKVNLSVKNYTYNGKVKTPTFTVRNESGTKLTKGTHYTVTYASGRKNVGTYKVTIKGKGNYTGTQTATFKINPNAASVNSLISGKKKLTVKLNRVLSQSTGYQIQYSTDEEFRTYKIKTVSKHKTRNVALTGLKSKTTYFVRVRTYKTIGKTKYYSNWSYYEHKKTK